MFLINFLDRNITDRYYPAFECICAVEVSLMLIQFRVSLPVIRAVWRSQLHRNLRLRMCLCISHGTLFNLVRLYVIYQQVFGPSEKVTTTATIVCSLIRETFITYISALLLFIAIDRYFASKYWNWYDRGGIPTTIFFVGMESIHLSSTYFAAYRLVYGYVTDMPNLIHNGVYLLGGLAIYLVIYRSDYREIQILKKGAAIDSYSVTRSYQLRENINLMKMFSRIALPFGSAMVPEFLFWPTYSLISDGSEHVWIKYFSVALYDAWFAIIAIIAVVSVPLCQPQIAKHMPARLRFRFFAESKLVEQRNVTAETDIYFKQLEANWN